jgi:hypothetical protein
MHVGPKRKEQIDLATDIFVVLPIEGRSSDYLWEASFQYIETTMKKFRGHRRCTHRVVSEHHGEQDGRYDDQKRKKKM